MQKVYTQIDGTFVFPKPEDLDTLKPDSCVVRKVDGKLCITPLSGLKGKAVEGGRNGYSQLWGYLKEGEEKPFLLIEGRKRELKFCGFCKDRLNGITGNCFNSNVKPNGCSFDPAEEVKPFRISLEGWKKLRPTDVNEYSGFTTPYLSAVKFDAGTVRRNRKMRVVARHLWEYQEKKIEKYCSRCIHQGTCKLTSQKVIEHCMETEEKTAQKCLTKIRRRYGTVDEFLGLLAYGGGRLMYRLRKNAEESEWRVSQPLSRKKFLIIQPYRYFMTAKVPRKVVEDRVTAKAIPSEEREKTAALAWYYLEQYQHRRLWVSPKTGGIEAAHRTHGSYYFFRRQTFTSFSEILYFFQR